MPRRWQSRAMPASRRKLIRCSPATPGSERACSASSHATSKHSCLRVGRALAALDRLRGHGDAGHVLVHVAERARRAHEADRRDERARSCEPLRRRASCMNAARRSRLEADLQLQEARARTHLLPARGRRGSRTAARRDSRPRRGRASAPDRSSGRRDTCPCAIDRAERRRAGSSRGRRRAAPPARRRP